MSPNLRLLAHALPTIKSMSDAASPMSRATLSSFRTTLKTSRQAAEEAWPVVRARSVVVEACSPIFPESAESTGKNDARRMF